MAPAQDVGALCFVACAARIAPDVIELSLVLLAAKAD